MTKWIWAEADWLHALPGGAEAGDGVLLLDRGDGRHFWGTRVPGSAIESTAGAFVASALMAVAAVPPSQDSVDVIGEGLLAALVRRLLGDRIQPHSASAIIDTTGSPELIAQATVNLPRRGALLLAAPARADDAMMRTYADIHVKGLSLIGVRWSGSPPDAPRDLMDFALESLVDLNKPKALSRGLWYRLERQ